jgi:hypothetical protein
MIKGRPGDFHHEIKLAYLFVSVDLVNLFINWLLFLRRLKGFNGLLDAWHGSFVVLEHWEPSLIDLIPKELERPFLLCLKVFGCVGFAWRELIHNWLKQHFLVEAVTALGLSKL